MAPAAANDGGKSTHKKEPHSPMSKNIVDPKATKLCHIVKRADFDGYGFNLHTEKSKPGQYIGKVDSNSPAEVAGLREGFRILEVNGIPINNETHKQVVQRIKAIAWEVKLLISTDVNINMKVDASNKNKQINEKQTKKKENSTDKNHIKISSDNDSTRTITPASAMNSNANGHSKTAKNMSNTDVTTSYCNNSKEMTLPPPIITKVDDEKYDAVTSMSPSSSLKLPSTAAEMRAILQSKKKLNPKSEEVNLQKKYEIIQKL